MPNTHFSLGICTVGAVYMAIQDWYGLQGYLELVASHWIELPWQFSAVMAVACVCISAALERYEQRK